jgi:hypothetical protein
MARAQRERLAERPEWRALLHYKTRRLSQNVESQVDEPGFFLAADGKHNAQGELNATLQSFFQTGASGPDQSTQCRFVARYLWLKQELAFDRDKLPELPCGHFQRWFEEMNPGRITLVFPSAYLNNPASMFGHTLLRVDEQGEKQQTPLLANTVNYAADTRQQRGVPYALKGLFGGYHGRFSIAPYYAAVKTYGDFENRDIWEFELNLNQEEISQLLRHVWEMRAVWFDYYFLDENCSYHLLSLLETARPGLQLTDRFPLWAIPSETVRVVTEAGLVQKVRFRAARNTILQERLQLMDASQQELAKHISLGDPAAAPQLLQGLAPKEQARVVELALDYLAYRQSPRFGAAEEIPGRLNGLLMVRSRLEVPDQTPVIKAPEVAPGTGHKPARAGIGYGIEDRRHFVEVSASPGYHDLLDSEGGYTRGARVSLLRGALRYYPEAEKAELEQFDVIDVMSLSPWNRFLHPVSWKASAGAERKHLSGGDSVLLGKLSSGAGLSRDFARQTMVYGFAEGSVELNDRFAYFIAPGVGPRIGIVHDFTGDWRSEAHFLWQLFFLHEWRNDYEAAFQNRFTINSQNIAGLDLEWKRNFGNSFPGLKLYWQHYF